MNEKYVKKRIINVSKNVEEKIYYTEDEFNQIEIERKDQQQLKLLEPSQEEIEKAEFELSILILLEEVGII